MLSILSYFWHCHDPQHKLQGGSAHCSSCNHLVYLSRCTKTSFLALLPNKFLLPEPVGSSSGWYQCQHLCPGTSTTIIPNSNSVWQWISATALLPVPPWAAHPASLSPTWPCSTPVLGQALAHIWALHLGGGRMAVLCQLWCHQQ